MTRIATTLPYTELEVADGNFDTTRSTIDRVIIHTMDGTWQGAAARFDNPTEQVSAHYGIKLDGSLVHWLEETYTGYHSGNYAMNQRSIGIEHEDGGDYNGVRPDVLYTESAKLVRDICLFYNIPIDRQHILKHSEVIATGCPDALDIERIVREAAIPPQDQTIDELRNARDDNWNLYQTEVQKNTNLTKQLQDEQKNNQDLRNANDSITKADADLGTQLLAAQHATTALQANLDILAANVGLKAPYTFDDIVKTIEALKAPHDELVKQVQPTLEGLAQAAQGTSILKTMTFWEKVKYLFL